MQELAGKVAVVTGGASGIGLALARRFAAEKMKLALLDIEAPALAAVEAELRAAGATVLAIRTDVGKLADLEAAAAQVHATYGVANVICNNAGVGGPGGPLWGLSEADWDWTLGVNLSGVIRGVRLFLPPLLASGQEGHVVNTASMAGLTSTPMLGPYTVAKHGVVALSEVLAKDLELMGAKVGVSVLCPGFVQTQIHSSMRNRPADSRGGAAPATPQGQGFQQVIQQLVAGGISPDVVADRVVAAIREPRFYILTHPEMKGAIAHRMKEILDERPPGIDPTFRAMLGKPVS